MSKEKWSEETIDAMKAVIEERDATIAELLVVCKAIGGKDMPNFGHPQHISLNDAIKMARKATEKHGE